MERDRVMDAGADPCLVQVLGEGVAVTEGRADADGVLVPDVVAPAAVMGRANSGRSARRSLRSAALARRRAFRAGSLRSWLRAMAALTSLIRPLVPTISWW